MQGPQHPPLTPNQLLSPSLWLESVERGRVILVALGHPCPQPAPVPSFLGTGGVTLSHPTCVVYGVFPHTGHPNQDGRQHTGPWLPPLFPSHLGGWIQPSHQVPHGSSRPSCPQESLLHRHQDFTHPVHRQNATQTWGRWDTVPSHTGSPIGITKPCHSPGRCPSGAHLPPVPGSSPLCSRAAQLVRDAGMMEYPAGAEEARQNLSIHQGPHFLPSALGDN